MVKEVQNLVKTCGLEPWLRHGGEVWGGNGCPCTPRRDGNRKQKKLRNRSGGAATSSTSTTSVSFWYQVHIVEQCIDLMEVTEIYS